MFFRSIVILIVLLSGQQSLAQDTTKTKEETKKYSKIELYSNKHKFTRFIYKLIFEPVQKTVVKTNAFRKVKKTKFRTFEGKIIRNIKINSFDPFGYTVRCIDEATHSNILIDQRRNPCSSRAGSMPSHRSGHRASPSSDTTGHALRALRTLRACCRWWCPSS